jgi:signal transduction histidine kinase
MKKWAIPMGIVPLFRFFVFVRLILGGFELFNSFGHFRIFSFETAALATVIECSVLLGYLSWPWLKERLGNKYLPIGLMIATLGPWLENLLGLQGYPAIIDQVSRQAPFFVPEIGRVLLMVTQLQLIFTLFIPVILVGWQFSLRQMTIYCLSLLALDALQIMLWPGSIPVNLLVVVAAAIMRTFLFLLVGFVVNRLSAEQKQQNALLLQANRQMGHYTGTLEMLATSRERNRLARELHDTVAHTLSGLAVNLEAVSALWESDSAQALEILKQSLAVTRNGLEETRRAIQALRAGPLEDLGLVIALKQMAISSSERYGLDLDLDLPEKLENLDPEVEQCIYRVASEGLRNIGQHARASVVHMRLARLNEQVEFMLKDDGRGFTFTPAEKNEQFGIQGMFERAAAVGGVLTFDSLPEQGTELKFIVAGK